MAQQYTIHKVEYPIVGGTAAHNYLAVFDPAGNVIHEFHGLATDKNGNPKPIGYLPSDRLKYWHVKESWYYQGNLYSENAPKSRELFSGSYEEVQEKVEIIKAIGKYLNEQDLPYPPLGFTGKNSNAFETTLQTGAGLNEQCGDDTRCKIPDGAWFTPSEGQLLTDEDTLKAIADNARQQYQEKLKGEQEVSLTGDEIELPDITVTAEKAGNSNDMSYWDWNNIDTFEFISVYTDPNGTQMIDASDLERLIAHADDNEDWWELATVLEKLDSGEYQMSGELSDEANQELEEIINSASKRASYSIPDDFFESRSAAYANQNEYYQSKYGRNDLYPHDTSSVY